MLCCIFKSLMALLWRRRLGALWAIGLLTLLSRMTSNFCLENAFEEKSQCLRRKMKWGYLKYALIHLAVLAIDSHVSLIDVQSKNIDIALFWNKEVGLLGVHQRLDYFNFDMDISNKGAWWFDAMKFVDNCLKGSRKSIYNAFNKSITLSAITILITIWNMNIKIEIPKGNDFLVECSEKFVHAIVHLHCYLIYQPKYPKGEVCLN